MIHVLTRRSFVRSAAAAFGGLVLPADAFGTGGRPLVKFGVLTDVHINHPLSDGWLEKNLRYLDGMKVDAVIFPGDLADLGYISQLRRVAAVGEKVFPNGRAADGRPVKLMYVTGKHDIGQWPDLWKNVPFERQRQIRFDCDNHEARVWDEIFHEQWELVNRRDVNDVPFVASQWLAARPPTDGRAAADLEAYFNALGHVAKRPVIVQTFVSDACPAPSVDFLVDLAKRFPGVFGYIKEESEGNRANERQAAECAAKPVIKTVFSAWGGWQWLYQRRALGTEGLVSELPGSNKTILSGCSLRNLKHSS